MCSASEVVLFERTTFLIIARSGDISMFDSDSDSEEQSSLGNGNVGANGSDGMGDALSPERFEKISELVKAFKISCR